MDETPNVKSVPDFKVNADSIRINPGLKIQRTDPAPLMVADDVGLNPLVPASISTGSRGIPQAQALRRRPGATLAEQFGAAPTIEDADPTRNPERIVPKVSRTLSAEQNAQLFSPRTSPLAPELNQEYQLASAQVSSVTTPQIPQLPTVTERFPAETNIDLKILVIKTIDKLGKDRAAEYFGKSVATITSWKTGKADPPLHAVQKVLDGSPKAQQQFLQVSEKVSFNAEGEGFFSVEHTKETVPVDICFCVKGDIPPYCMWPIITCTLNYGLGVKMMTDGVLPRARNMVAKMFLEGTAQWSLWLDSDVLPTIGNAPWWREIVRDKTVSERTASYMFLKRLLSHNQPMVGGVYSTRRKAAPLVIQPDLNPRNQQDKDLSNQIRANKATGLQEVDWLALGLRVIHRCVFEDILKRYSDRTPKFPGEPFPFFSINSNEGEDVAFDNLARSVGYKLLLDTELFAAHIGRYAFMPSESQYNGPIGFVANTQV